MIFLGAGASVPFGIPTSPKFTGYLVSMLQDENPQLLDDYFPYYKKVTGENPDFEVILTLLSSLTTPYDLSGVDINRVFQSDYPDYKKDYTKIIENMHDAIYNYCCNPFLKNNENYIEPKKLEDIFNVTYDFLLYNVIRDKRYDQIIFTTNYDPSVEIWCQKRNLSCIDGSTRTYNPEIKKIAPFQNHIQSLSNIKNNEDAIGLLRLHGSVWDAKVGESNFLKFDRPRDRLLFTDMYEELLASNRPELIFPGQENSLRRNKWYEYYRYFRDVLSGPCLFIGCSFRNPVIREPIQDNIRRGKISYLGILSPNPYTNLKRLFPDGKYPTDRIILIKGEFGKEDVLKQLYSLWIERVLKIQYSSGYKGFMDDCKNWLKTRLDRYTRG